MRKCCGYYCTMIAFVAMFFFSVIIVMETRYNSFLMYKMQFPEGAGDKNKFFNTTSAYVKEELEKEAKAKITPLLFAIGLNVLCAIGCIVQVKVLNRKERLAEEMIERQQRDDLMEEAKYD